MIYIKRFESYEIDHERFLDQYHKYYFNTEKFKYEIDIEKYIDGFWWVGFKAKKEDEYFYDHRIITNENPYKIMDTLIKCMKSFYYKKIKEVDD